MTLRELEKSENLSDTIERLTKEALITITQNHSKDIKHAVEQDASRTKSQTEFHGQKHLLQCIVHDLVSLRANVSF